MSLKIKKKLSKNAIATTTVVMLSSIFWGMTLSLTPKVVSETLLSQASAPNISSSELQQFAQIIEKLYTIEQETTQEIVQIIKQEGMSVDRFNAIVKWKKDPQEAPEPSVSDTEMENFKKAVTKIAQLQEQADTKIKAVFQSQELQVERFNQILEAVREDPNLQGQVQQILEK